MKTADTTPASLDTLIRQAADMLVRHDFRAWFYGDSTGFEGLVAASDALDDPRWADFVYGYFRAWAARATPYVELDNTVPGHTLCAVYERTQDPLLLQAATDIAAHLTSRPTHEGVYVSRAVAPLRAPYSGDELTAAELEIMAAPGPMVVVDCLHFDPPFFAHLGTLTGDDGLVEIAVQQALGYVKLLRDDETGLFHHLRLADYGLSLNPGWGRGQGWALLGLLDVLKYLPRSHSAWDELARNFRDLAQVMASHQRPDGHWNAIAQDPTSGVESSTAAFCVPAFLEGVTIGVLAETPFVEAAHRAWRAVEGSTDEHGVLTCVSAAVGVSLRLSHYAYVPVGELWPWGQGPLLLAAAAARRSLAA